MTQDQQKRQVAEAALRYVLDRLPAQAMLGIGTGSTANYFIDMLGAARERVVGAVASSSASETRLRAQGIPVFDLNEVEGLCFYVDGADEINARLEMIKGGGAALTREKIVASCAASFVCIADASKKVDTLGRFPLPVEVIPMAREAVARKLQLIGGTPVLRAGVLSDNGGQILDLHGLRIDNPCDLETQINQIPGVICNGIFAQNSADVLLLGTDEGVLEIHAENK